MKHPILVSRLLPSASKRFRREIPSSRAEPGRRSAWPSLRLFVLTCCVMSVAMSCARDGATRPDPDKSVTQVEKYQAYFKGLSLPYMEPLGCNQDRSCQLAEDFNDDGTVDLAGLYEYSGSTSRIGDNYVDLVIIYSSAGSDQPTHQIFRYVGAIDRKSQVLVNLEKQEAGVIELTLGDFTLTRPAINVRRDDQAPGTYFPTYYWNGKRFASIDKSAD